MTRYLQIAFVLLIMLAAYLGVRYVGSVVHFACEVPEEDCPPPFRIVGDLGYFLTGGDLVPLWNRAHVRK